MLEPSTSITGSRPQIPLVLAANVNNQRSSVFAVYTQRRVGPLASPIQSTTEGWEVRPWAGGKSEDRETSEVTQTRLPAVWRGKRSLTEYRFPGACYDHRYFPEMTLASEKRTPPAAPKIPPIKTPICKTGIHSKYLRNTPRRMRDIGVRGSLLDTCKLSPCTSLEAVLSNPVSLPPCPFSINPVCAFHRLSRTYF